MTGQKMDFYERVGIVCRRIPYGKVATYGQIAMLCGKPNNSRQVGYALNRGISGEVPAHRVVNHKGYLSGASAFADSAMQRRMLEAEVVQVGEENRVDLKVYGWRHTLKDALEFRRVFGDG